MSLAAPTAVGATGTIVPSTWLTPRAARLAPVHRWFVFPHSYAPQLVEWLLNRLSFDGGDVLDPFCGAGTTVVEAQRLGYQSVGIDLLPLAVLATRAKTQRPASKNFQQARRLALELAFSAPAVRPSQSLLGRAFTPTSYGKLCAALPVRGASSAKDCVRLAVLSVAREFSSLVADGGWLRATAGRARASEVYSHLEIALDQIEEDLEAVSRTRSIVKRADARELPVRDSSIAAVVTSPPYPNRHDYTRVFAVELELGFGPSCDLKRLRYQAVQSHPEARPLRPERPYKESLELALQISEIGAAHPDRRIPRMLTGYFRDMSDILREVRRVLRRGGRAAFVVGNAQYCGVALPVDEHLAAIGQQAGLVVEEILPLRFRGNSAQQMGWFGRNPSRESAVLFRRP